MLTDKKPMKLPDGQDGMVEADDLARRYSSRFSLLCVQIRTVNRLGVHTI